MTSELSRPTNISQLLTRRAAADGDQPCLIWQDQAITYRAAVNGAEAFAAGLEACSVRRGDRVLVVAHNSEEFIFLWVAVGYMGAVLLPANPESAPDELERLISLARPTLIVTSPGLYSTLHEITRTKFPGARCLPISELAHHPGMAMTRPRGMADDIVALIPTSGTTSRPKLVMQTHRSYILAAEGFPIWLGLTGQDRLLTCLPLFHINALVYSTLGAFASGASLALLPRFSARAFWHQAVEYKATQFNSIGAMIEILMRQPSSPAENQSLVRLCYCAPAPSEPRHREIETRFGLRLISGYGMSESPYGTVWPLSEPPRYGSLGRLRQHPTLGEINFARLIDDHGNEVPVGQPGELLLRNPTVMRGYFNDQAATSSALADGWLRTGDLVRQDADGIYYFYGRKKEMIRRRGHNIAPAEIEEALCLDDRVIEAAVVGVPSELSEEDIEAYVTLVRPGAASEAELLQHCREHLSRQKIPRRIIELSRLPRTPTGRIAKHMLAQVADQTTAAGAGQQPEHNQVAADGDTDPG
jgi:crotonobetaine/carnitine-CoA ligase